MTVVGGTVTPLRCRPFVLQMRIAQYVTPTYDGELLVKRLRTLYGARSVDGLTVRAFEPRCLGRYGRRPAAEFVGIVSSTGLKSLLKFLRGRYLG